MRTVGISRREFIKTSALVSLAGPLLSSCRSSTGGARPATATPDLYRLFKDPPIRARPFVRWWWNGNRLSKDEIHRELDALKKAGMGGVEINSIRFPETANSMGLPACEWLSDDWIEMVKTALAGAKARGLASDLLVGAGWPFGGEFLDRDQQTQMLALGTLNLSGGRKHRIARKAMEDAVDPEFHSKYEGMLKELAMVRLVPAIVHGVGESINLDRQARGDVIEVAVPPGDHVLHYLVKLTGFMAVINGVAGSNGPALNHYDRRAVEAYLDRMSDRIRKRIAPLGNHVRAAFVDSLELEGANWCHDMPAQFKKRRGYDLAPYLPFVILRVGPMGNAVDEPYGARMAGKMPETIERVRYDFETTRMELFNERFLRPLRAWCWRNGMELRMQAYGKECHPLDASRGIDIPECETWIWKHVGEDFSGMDCRRGRAYTTVNKFVSSGARLAGKRLVSCEEMTNVEVVFNESLERIKIAGDQSVLSGVTHSILHGFNFSPPDAPFPGWVRYGTFFSERNPWWPHLRKWTDYKARLSAVFQAVDSYADVAILHPTADLWMKRGAQRDPFPIVDHPPYQHQVWEAAHQNGNNCDYVSEHVLQQARFADGEFRFGTRGYRTLILLAVESVLPDTARALEDFARAGGVIVFVEKAPRRSPRLLDAGGNDARVAEAVAAIRRNHATTVFLYPPPGNDVLAWFREMQGECGIKPCLGIETPASFVSQVRYRSGDRDIFFISNYSRTRLFSSKMSFDAAGRVPWIWNPENGDRHPAAGCREGGLKITLGPAEAKLLVFDREQGEAVREEIPAPDVSCRIDGPWTLRLEHVNGEIVEKELGALMNLGADETLRSFAGKAVYEAVVMPDDASRYRYLDLGRVHGVSEVTLNGCELGAKWYGRHLYAIPDGVLRSAPNMIRVRVTGMLGNYLKSLKDNKTARLWTEGQEWQPSGMEGPVRWIGGAPASG